MSIKLDSVTFVEAVPHPVTRRMNQSYTARELDITMQPRDGLIALSVPGDKGNRPVLVPTLRALYMQVTADASSFEMRKPGSK